MPNKVLKYQTAIDFFNMCFPTSQISMNLPLKIFYCITFIHVHNHNCGKFDPKAFKYIFVGYSSTLKGYKYFDPCTKRMFATMDVTFFETKSYFSHDHPQGENKRVDFIPIVLFELDQPLLQPPLVQQQSETP